MKKRQTTVEIAADWVAAVDAGLTAEQRAELDAWLAADPSHRFAYNRLEGQYKAVDRLSEFRPSNYEDDEPLLRPMSKPWSSTHARTQPVIDTESWTISRGMWILFAILLVAVAAGFVGYRRWWRPNFGELQQSSTSALGLQKTLALPDGSRVTLNTDSAIDIFYSRDSRLLQLTRGEAYFVVAENRKRPFIVQVGHVAVRAVGTEFSIRLQSDQIDVLVTEGLLQVRDSATGASLLPRPAVFHSPEFEEPVVAGGELAVIPYKPTAAAAQTAPPLATMLPVVPAEMARRLAWRDRRIIFDATPLRDVATEFNRYNRQQLRVADDAIGRLLVGGTYRTDETETVIRLVKSKYGLYAERTDDVIILKQPGSY